MKNDVELFRPQKELILKYVRAKGIDKVALYSATTSIPLIAIYSFILEDMVEYKEIAESKLAMLKEFYK